MKENKIYFIRLALQVALKRTIIGFILLYTVTCGGTEKIIETFFPYKEEYNIEVIRQSINIDETTSSEEEEALINLQMGFNKASNKFHRAWLWSVATIINMPIIFIALILVGYFVCTVIYIILKPFRDTLYDLFELFLLDDVVIELCKLERLTSN